MRLRLATVRAEIVRRGSYQQKRRRSETAPFNHRAKVWRRVSRSNRPSANDSIAAVPVRLSSVVYGCDVSTGLRRDLDFFLRDGRRTKCGAAICACVVCGCSFIRYGVAHTFSSVALLPGIERRGILPIDRDCDPSLRAISSHQASYEHRWHIRKRSGLDRHDGHVQRDARERQSHVRPAQRL